MFRERETGIPTCVTVTLVDGLVLSRSGFDEIALGRCIWKGAEDRESRAENQFFARPWTQREGIVGDYGARVLDQRYEVDRRWTTRAYGLPVWAGILPLEAKSAAYTRRQIN